MKEESLGTKWYALEVDDALTAVKSSKMGLSKPDAAARLSEYGPNRLTPGKSRTMLEMIWDQLYSLITAILAAAAVAAAIFQEYVELGFIVTVIVVNVVIGVVQEGRAEAATKAIAEMVAVNAIAFRNGRKLTVPVVDLVPGDIVVLTSGDKVPADVRLVEVTSFRVVEAALTGESQPITKQTEALPSHYQLSERINMAFMGSFVVGGDALGLVVCTGDRAEIGRINELVSNVEAVQTPLQKQLTHFGFVLSIACLLLAVLVFIVSFVARGDALKDAIELTVSVAVALIPEGLPTVVTITLALGVQALASKKAIVRSLPAIEALGSVTCICSDKTGTLTKNEMTAVEVHTTVRSAGINVTGTGFNPYGELQFQNEALNETVQNQIRYILLPAALCNDSTLMPVLSAEVPTLLRTQSLNLPNLSGIDLTHGMQKPIRISSRSIQTSSKKGGQFAQEITAVETKIGEPTDVTKSPQLKPLQGPGNSEVPTKQLEWYQTGDPTETALTALVMKAGLNFRTLHELDKLLPRVGIIPFTSENKFMATVHNVPTAPGTPARRLLFVKGAFDVLLPRCATQIVGTDASETELLQPHEWQEINSLLAKKGMRVLAICQRELTEDEITENVGIDMVLEGPANLQLNALIAIVDPPRPEVIDAIETCHNAGIMVKMITGDHADTARTIGEWIGIHTSLVLTGAQLESMSDLELEEKVEDCNIFARSSPEHKLRIVKALQKRRHVVVMTGDGVNDAPALRQANVGVAMGKSGTAVAREAARMVLQDDNFTTIEIAVHLGRATYDNLRKLIMFLLPTTIAQGFSVAFAVFFGIPSPLTQIQILFVNMVTAATLGLVLAAEGPEPDVMSRAPRHADKQLIGKYVLWRSFFVSGLLIGGMLGQQAWSRSLDDGDEAGHTVAMNVLVFSQCLYCLSCRFLRKSSISFSAITGNKWLAAMIALNVMFQLLIIYVPQLQGIWGTSSMDGYEWLRVLGTAFVIFGLVEVEKQLAPQIGGPYIVPFLKRIGDKYHAITGQAEDQETVEPVSSAGKPTSGGITNRKEEEMQDKPKMTEV
jgi:magnesium-transporting ATPase (P-type)